MDAVDILMVGVIIVILGVGGYLLYLNWPGGEEMQYEDYQAKFVFNVSGNMQFYPNLRYREKTISYSVDGACNSEKRKEIEEALDILEDRTILNFARMDNGEIEILCSEIAPTPEQEGHFIAGEGGPSEIIEAGEYNVIFSGKVSLYREEKCETPQVALHEILHALGFEHNSDEDSIMFPLTDCSHKLDGYIINKINYLYSIDSNPDLLIKSASASKSGRYMDFEVGVLNGGFEPSGDFELLVFIDGKEIKSFELDGADIGSTRIFTVNNLRVPRDFGKVVFEIEYGGSEISKTNNNAEIFPS